MISIVNWLRNLIPNRAEQSFRRRKKPPNPHHRKRPLLEILENRLAPTVQLLYGGPMQALTLNELLYGTSTVTLSDSNTTLLTINLNGGRFDGSSTAAASGPQYFTPGNVITANPTQADHAQIDISTANEISTLFTHLGGDTLNLGTIANSAGGISTISASAGLVDVLSSASVDMTQAAGGAGSMARDRGILGAG